ncbi:DEAD/DEAH box helicase [Dactylosporangium sp. NBC_01737]|uniref:DEAD/DEAH box helicase n=1 Tax=Dactylosporangium sp. NBC_01737 TaxID=2975959 RepID=UPI003FA38D08
MPRLRSTTVTAGTNEDTGFAELGLRDELLKALTTLGYEEPTPIQREAIPPMLAGRDLLGQAATGTGKTAAFSLPLLQTIPSPGGDNPSALILVPTRELAVQVSEAIHRYGKDLGTRVLPIYGGQPIGRQLRALEHGVDVVVATPGRALDHISRGTLHLHDLRVVVLDEADEMLDMGFAEDIEAILQETPEDRQTVLFSATMPPRIDGLARSHLNDPVRIQIGREPTAAGESPLVRQVAYVVTRAHKPAALGRVLDVEAPGAALVFCRTRDEVDQLTETLNGRGYRAEALHGGMGQEQRDRVMARLRNGTADLLVATDVAARGLDVEHLTHVVNYDVPSAPESYVHRIGRVGRAGREGVAITLAEPREHRMLKTIERITKQRILIEKVPTVADLRARRLELTRAALHESLVADDAALSQFRVVVETLSDEFDLMEIAIAAVKIAHDATSIGDGDQEEIPEITLRAPRDAGFGDRPGSGDRSGPGRRVAVRDADGRGRGREAGGRRVPAGGMTRLFVGAGRAAGIRPQDLVGAITGESSLSGRDIGAIEITDRFSLVEVPEGSVDEVIDTLRRTTLKGRRPVVRRERFQG